jgi:hypothetical protein
VFKSSKRAVKGKVAWAFRRCSGVRITCIGPKPYIVIIPAPVISSACSLENTRPIGRASAISLPDGTVNIGKRIRLLRKRKGWLKPSLKVDFQGSRVTSDGSLFLVRELDEH